MRTLVLAIALVGSAGTAWGQETPPEKSGKPRNGYWRPESIQFDGKEQLPDSKSREALTLVIADSEYRMYYMTDPKEGKALRLFIAQFKPDAAARTFELEVKDGQRKGMKVHGIFELNGSQLKLCYGPEDKPRPTRFDAPAGSGLFNEVWSYLDPQPKPSN
jgi:uncharacterized protein (TIGR03067 family)